MITAISAQSKKSRGYSLTFNMKTTKISMRNSIVIFWSLSSGSLCSLTPSGHQTSAFRRVFTGPKDQVLETIGLEKAYSSASRTVRCPQAHEDLIYDIFKSTMTWVILRSTTVMVMAQHLLGQDILMDRMDIIGYVAAPWVSNQIKWLCWQIIHVTINNCGLPIKSIVKKAD